MSIIAALILTTPLACWSPCDAPFDDARYLPRDVNFYLHINRGSELRETVGAYELGSVLSDRLDDVALIEAWQRLADVAKTEQGQLFDEVLGQTLTVAVRLDESSREFEWAALSDVPVQTWVTLHRRLRPRLVRAEEDVAAHLLPEHALLMFYHKESGQLLIGPDPDAGPSLFNDLLRQLVRGEGKCLSRTSGLREAQSLGDGDVAVYARHALPLGGWSAAVLSLDAPQLTIQHASHFTDSPFGSASRTVSFDRAMMESLNMDGSVVVAQWFRIPTGPTAMLMRAQMPAGSITDRLLAGLGDRMLVVIEPQEGAATFAVSFAIEMQREGIEIDDIDRAMTGLRSVAAKLQRTQPDDPPTEVISKHDDGSRRMNMPAAIVRLYAPLLQPAQSINLTWRESATGSARWCVFSTDGEALGRMIERMQVEGEAPQDVVQVVGQSGRSTGATIAALVDALSQRVAHVIAKQGGQPAESPLAAQTMLETIRSISSSAESFEWTFDTPGVNRIRSSWRLMLRQRPTEPGNAPAPLRTAGNR